MTRAEAIAITRCVVTATKALRTLEEERAKTSRWRQAAAELADALELVAAMADTTLEVEP
jgi:hypothetical protein